VTADIVIVGGGVIGASVAYHLAASGTARVVVVDRGDGSTARATGGFRVQFGSEINVRLSLLAREKLLRFEEETGVDPGYRPCGYLFIAATTEQLGRMREAGAVQRAAGFQGARELSPPEVLAANPALASEGIAGGFFCPLDGFIRPTEIQRGYREAATRLGATFLTDSVAGFRLKGGRIVAALTDRGSIDCGTVVNAAGPWAGAVASLAEVSLELTPLRRQVAVTAPTDRLPADMPMTIFADGFHLRVRDGQVLLLQPSEPADEPFDVGVDPSWVEAVARTAAARIPCLRGLPIESSYAGLYEMSPDEHAILGPAQEVPNLFLVNGSSGHGVMHAPALGQLVSEMLRTGAARSLDVSPLRPSRFREGRPNPIRSLL
jgi:sarcosine oxidase, subunit beta